MAVLLAALVVAADIAARIFVQDRLAGYVRASTGARSASARIESFPFLLHVVGSGTVERVDVTARGVPAGALRIDKVEVIARHVRIDRHDLVRDRRVVVGSIANADVTVWVTAAELTAVTGQAVSFSGSNALRVKVDGVSLPLAVGIDNGHVLTLEAAGTRLASIDLATSGVIPTCHMLVESWAGELRMSCHVAPVPEKVIAALSAR